MIQSVIVDRDAADDFTGKRITGRRGGVFPLRRRRFGFLWNGMIIKASRPECTAQDPPAAES
jgi:hypothetical protein